jgi:hypothetical protein
VVWALNTLLFDKNNITSKFYSAKEFLQTYFRGIVVNKTRHSIRVSDHRRVITLLPGESSIQRGIYDVDSLVIDRPTRFAGQKYNSGVIKFCDFSYLVVQQANQLDEIQPNKRQQLCKFVRGIQHYPNINQAFP